MIACGVCRSVMVSLHESEGTWGVATYLTLMNHTLTPASKLPFVYCNFKVINHVKADKSVEQGAQSPCSSISEGLCYVTSKKMSHHFEYLQLRVSCCTMHATLHVGQSPATSSHLNCFRQIVLLWVAKERERPPSCWRLGVTAFVEGVLVRCRRSARNYSSWTCRWVLGVYLLGI